MVGNRAIAAALALLFLAGCGQKPAEGDIDMGPPVPQQAASISNSAPESNPISPSAAYPLPVTSEDIQTVRVVGTCNIELVNGQAFAGSPVKVSKAAPISINGWLLDRASSGSETAELRLINVADASAHKIDIQANLTREDVAASMKADVATLKPGFNTEFIADGLPVGDYRLQLVIPSSNQGAAVCDNGRVIALTD